MNRFSEEMKLIPRLAWAIAFLFGLGVPVLSIALFIVTVTRNGLGRFPIEAVFVSLAAICFSVYVLLIGYIASDARRRGMRPVLWCLLAIFVPSAVGIILYFILREPLLQGCPKCGASVKPAFTFCPVCGEALAKACPGCRSAVQPEWSHCARCGTALTASVREGL
jgi:peptidoglycan/LPS O-acetylase OafA/YrhL